MNITTLSLVDIKDCAPPINRPISTRVPLQLIQRAEFLSVRIIQCKVKIIRTVFYCGMNHHISLVANSQMEFIQETSRETCDKLHRTNFYETGESRFSNIGINETTVRELRLAGKVDNSGNCEQGHYSDHYGSWDNVVAQGQIFITAHEYYATAQLENDELILRTGVRCTYSKGACIDENEGYIYWDTQVQRPEHCDFSQYVLLFRGYGDKVIDANSLAQENPVYTASQEDISFAFAITGRISFCGFTLLKTEHPRLFLTDDVKDDEYFPRMSTATAINLNLLTYVNSKFIFLERHLRTQVIALYNDILVQQCRIETQVLHNLLAIAHYAPDEFAYRLMKESGYIAHLAGEVVRIAKCVPVEVLPRRSDLCFQELPVHRGNDSWFMMPRTHILVKTGNQLECNTALAPMFKLNNEWIQILPQITTANQPEILSTKTQHSWKYISPQNLALGGIYTDRDLQKLRDHIMFPVEKPAVLHTIARGAVGQESLSQGIYVNSLINEAAIKETLDKAWGKVFGFFNFVGTFSVTVFGFWVVLRSLKFIIDTIVHGYALHTVFGWSLWLLGAIWDSVTNLLLHLHRRANEQNRKESDVENQFENNQTDEHEPIEDTNNSSKIYPTMVIPTAKPSAANIIEN